MHMFGSYDHVLHSMRKQALPWNCPNARSHAEPKNIYVCFIALDFGRGAFDVASYLSVYLNIV